MLDHVGLEVRDIDVSRAFYEGALAPLGIGVLLELPGSVGFGEATEHGPKPYFWLSARGREPVTGVHVAFAAPDHDTVEAVCHRGG